MLGWKDTQRNHDWNSKFGKIYKSTDFKKQVNPKYDIYKEIHSMNHHSQVPES